MANYKLGTQSSFSNTEIDKVIRMLEKQSPSDAKKIIAGFVKDKRLSGADAQMVSNAYLDFQNRSVHVPEDVIPTSDDMFKYDNPSIRDKNFSGGKIRNMNYGKGPNNEVGHKLIKRLQNSSNNLEKELFNTYRSIGGTINNSFSADDRTALNAAKAQMEANFDRSGSFYDKDSLLNPDSIAEKLNRDFGQTGDTPATNPQTDDYTTQKELSSKEKLLLEEQGKQRVDKATDDFAERKAANDAERNKTADDVNKKTKSTIMDLEAESIQNKKDLVSDTDKEYSTYQREQEDIIAKQEGKPTYAEKEAAKLEAEKAKKTAAQKAKQALNETPEKVKAKVKKLAKDIPTHLSKALDVLPDAIQTQIGRVANNASELRNVVEHVITAYKEPINLTEAELDKSALERSRTRQNVTNKIDKALAGAADAANKVATSTKAAVGKAVSVAEKIKPTAVEKKNKAIEIARNNLNSAKEELNTLKEVYADKRDKKSASLLKKAETKAAGKAKKLASLEAKAKARRDRGGATRLENVSTDMNRTVNERTGADAKLRNIKHEQVIHKAKQSLKDYYADIEMSQKMPGAAAFDDNRQKRIAEKTSRKRLGQEYDFADGKLSDDQSINTKGDTALARNKAMSDTDNLDFSNHSGKNRDKAKGLQAQLSAMKADLDTMPKSSVKNANSANGYAMDTARKQQQKLIDSTEKELRTLHKTKDYSSVGNKAKKSNKRSRKSVGEKLSDIDSFGKGVDEFINTSKDIGGAAKSQGQKVYDHLVKGGMDGKRALHEAGLIMDKFSGSNDLGPAISRALSRAGITVQAGAAGTAAASKRAAGDLKDSAGNLKDSAGNFLDDTGTAIKDKAGNLLDDAGNIIKETGSKVDKKSGNVFSKLYDKYKSTVQKGKDRIDKGRELPGDESSTRDFQEEYDINTEDSTKQAGKSEADLEVDPDDTDAAAKKEADKQAKAEKKQAKSDAKNKKPGMVKRGGKWVASKVGRGLVKGLGPLAVGDIMGLSASALETAEEYAALDNEKDREAYRTAAYDKGFETLEQIPDAAKQMYNDYETMAGQEQYGAMAGKVAEDFVVPSFKGAMNLGSKVVDLGNRFGRSMGMDWEDYDYNPLDYGAKGWVTTEREAQADPGKYYNNFSASAQSPATKQMMHANNYKSDHTNNLEQRVNPGSTEGDANLNSNASKKKDQQAMRHFNTAVRKDAKAWADKYEGADLQGMYKSNGMDRAIYRGAGNSFGDTPMQVTQGHQYTPEEYAQEAAVKDRYNKQLEAYEEAAVPPYLKGMPKKDRIQLNIQDKKEIYKEYKKVNANAAKEAVAAKAKLAKAQASSGIKNPMSLLTADSTHKQRMNTYDLMSKMQDNPSIQKLGTDLLRQNIADKYRNPEWDGFSNMIPLTANTGVSHKDWRNWSDSDINDLNSNNSRYNAKTGTLHTGKGSTINVDPDDKQWVRSAYSALNSDDPIDMKWKQDNYYNNKYRNK